MRVRAWPMVVVCGCLTGCVSSNPREQAGGNFLSGISAVHSEVDMQVSLAIASQSPDCAAYYCPAIDVFEDRVSQIGQRLSNATFARFPELSRRFDKFEFVVADKQDCGTKSSAAGRVVVLRGIERLELDDAALAFVIAREMAHVVAGHHEDNTLTSIVISVGVQLFMPMLNLARGAAAVIASNPAVSSLLGSAVSMAGTSAMRANLRPTQVQQAEELSLELLLAAGYDAKGTIDAMQKQAVNFPLEEEWVLELRGSVSRIAKLTAGPTMEPRFEQAAEEPARISETVLSPVVFRVPTLSMDDARGTPLSFAR